MANDNLMMDMLLFRERQMKLLQRPETLMRKQRGNHLSF
jgi:hypothetical protein